MIALYILGALLVILLLLAILRIGFIISYYGGSPKFGLKIGFLTFDDVFEGVDPDSTSLELKPKKKTAKPRKEAEKESKPKLIDAIRVIKKGVWQLLHYFKKYARLDKYRVRINLATDDPAATAILYGSLAGIVSAMHSFALSVKNRSYRDGDIYTEYKPDFYAEKPDIAIDIGISLRVWQILLCFFVYRRTMKNLKKLPPKADKTKKGDTDNE